ncbi:alpha/beta hydrolase [Anaeromicropila herbilytica]|uniref:Lipase n=1 Tax=Anaeromicropila herbilytica TaxID=2785025 RepID=A0A7R7EI55_9FIRM|nr:alpha/beta hydrolase [Anaeromicropila herbilytica]BCN29202.1 lipase [Anaeromicropila herbilytica]
MKKSTIVKPLCPPGRPPRYEDVPYADVVLDNGQSHTLMMDIYQDLNQKEPGPCIIYYFGGGWMWGEYKQVTQKAVYCRDLVKLVEQGYTIISPSYRLASQSVFPACIHDCKGVVRFLKANANTYHIDPERIGVLGNSAGGHLAAMVAMSSECVEMEGNVGGNLEYSSAVKAAAVFYAPADLEECIRAGAAELDGPPKDLVGTEIDNVANQAVEIETQILGYTGEGRSLWSLNKVLESGDTNHPDWKYIELARKCSANHYASASCPPMIIMHGGQDQVVPINQSENLYHELIAAGADATYVSCSKACHGPSMGKAADEMAYRFLMDRL